MVSLVSLPTLENPSFPSLENTILESQKMFKRYSKNGGETSDSSLAPILAREAERLSSLCLEYDLDPKQAEGPTTVLRFRIRYHLVSLHNPASQNSPRSVRFEVSEVMTTVMKVSSRFLPFSAVFRECGEQISTPSTSPSVSLVLPVSLNISRRERSLHRRVCSWNGRNPNRGKRLAI